eukprot:COSAG05_NODE_5511_length_1157_cov_0.809074_1_plen_27_part_01
MSMYTPRLRLAYMNETLTFITGRESNK